MNTSPVWEARDQVSAAHKAWIASRTSTGSTEHAAYMAAKKALEQVKRATPAAKPVILAPSAPRCCALATPVKRSCVCAGISTCPTHGEIHHGTHD